VEFENSLLNINELQKNHHPILIQPR